MELVELFIQLIAKGVFRFFWSKIQWGCMYFAFFGPDRRSGCGGPPLNPRAKRVAYKFSVDGNYL